MEYISILAKVFNIAMYIFKDISLSLSIKLLDYIHRASIYSTCPLCININAYFEIVKAFFFKIFIFWT